MALLSQKFKIHALVSGAGSLLDIGGLSGSRLTITARTTPSKEMIGKAWTQVGDALRHAMGLAKEGHDPK